MPNYKHTYIHIAIWTTFLILSGLQMYLNNDGISAKILLMLVPNLFIFYINYLYLVPKFLLEKDTKTYFLWVSALVLFAIILQSVFRDSPPHLSPEALAELEKSLGKKLPPRPSIFGFNFIFPLFFNLAFVVLGTSIRIYEEWNINERNKRDIEAEKAKNELHLLKNQLSPHFLFNSLNSIYSLTNKKSDDAPEAVITLSELMRYMLYRADSELVPLQDEIQYLQNYIKLQRLRFADSHNVEINVRGDIKNQKIRPLMLISFIENAFKYGTDYKGNTEVKITINVEGENLHFNCVNLIGERNKDNDDSGIGLRNTRDRLDLLYPHRHKFSVTENDKRYIVNLDLVLDK